MKVICLKRSTSLSWRTRLGRETLRCRQSCHPSGRWEFRFPQSVDSIELFERPQGAVPYGATICQNHGSIRPLDVIKLTLHSPCNDPDHPEDWHYDLTQPWQFISRVDPVHLRDLADTPERIWHDHGDNRSVPAGYVPRMGAVAATLYLIKSPPGWTFTHWKEPNHYGPSPKTFRRLEFFYAGARHDFSVTDTDFTRRHKIYDIMQLYTHQTLPILNPGNAYFCLSLTKLTPKFSREHHKICATIFEI